MSTQYYRSVSDPLYDASPKKLDDMREYVLHAYNCNLTMFIESYTEMTLQQAEQDDSDLMMMVDSGRNPQQIADDLYAEYESNRKHRSMNSLII